MLFDENEMLKFLSQIPNIGDGGCGIAALSIARWEEKYLEIFDQKFVFYYFLEESDYADYLRFEMNSEILMCGKKYEICCPGHVGILLNSDEDFTEFFDCKRDYAVPSHEVHVVERDVLLALINKPDEWKADFDRKIQIPLIEKKLKISLNDVIR